MGITSRPKSIRAFQEIRLEHRFQDSRDRSLQQAILDRRDSQRELHINAVNLWAGLRSNILSTRFVAKASRY
jgi:hypothetical protein